MKTLCALAVSSSGIRYIYKSLGCTLIAALLFFQLIACETPGENPTPCVQACVDTQLMLEPTMFTTSLTMQSDMQAQLDINMVAYPPGWAADMVITVENENYSSYWTEALANWSNYNTQEIPMWYLVSGRAHLIADEPVDIECLSDNYCPRAEDWHVVIAVQDQYDLDWKCVEFGGQTSDVMYHWTCSNLTLALKEGTYDVINSARNLLTVSSTDLILDTSEAVSIEYLSLDVYEVSEPRMSDGEISLINQVSIGSISCARGTACLVHQLATKEPQVYKVRALTNDYVCLGASFYWYNESIVLAQYDREECSEDN